ncbi:hypothetical protein DRP53_07730 [candidate division WOR-3 bacterium]|uniref:Tetratricopeptide repeat protein n=1 Tax=candidate division WOR-3 bacterium TaxID=2052148 RepID=A0A660SFJ3_UNCW3|nr:MAG: hypothetical protein DRP53_07730 [candidate division WOR-3 bacterium]
MIIERSSGSSKGMGKDNRQRKIAGIVEAANDLALRGEYKKAIAELERAVELNPEDGSLYNRLGDLCIKGDELEKAIDFYKKGIEAFKNNYYYRNAIALCKKVLRYDPKDFGIYLAMGDLLIELGDRGDALNCFFKYIEKQKGLDNKKEILNCLKHIQELGYTDDNTVDRMIEVYVSIGRKDLAKGLKKKVKADGAKQPSPSRPSESEQLVEEIDSALKKAIDELKGKKKPITDTVIQVEKGIAELRKAIRLDKVISALEESLRAFSNQQKMSIALLQKSLNLNLDTLQETIARLQRNSVKNMNTMEKLLKGLAQAMSLLSKSQRSFGEQIGDKLEELSSGFKRATKEAVEDIKALSSTYERATKDMCDRLTETSASTTALQKIVEDLKSGIERINGALLEFTTAQDRRGKKQSLYLVILMVLAVLMCGLLAFSAFK